MALLVTRAAIENTYQIYVEPGENAAETVR